VPTIDESGVPGYEAANWWGIVVPAGTSKAIIGRLDREVSEILQQADVVKHFAAAGAETDHLSQEAFRQYVVAETDKWTRVVKQAGIKPQ
jgi:tripartite-type tricarboxylate transporter receptor subunit TctC